MVWQKYIFFPPSGLSTPNNDTAPVEYSISCLVWEGLGAHSWALPRARRSELGSQGAAALKPPPKPAVFALLQLRRAVNGEEINGAYSAFPAGIFLAGSRRSKKALAFLSHEIAHKNERGLKPVRLLAVSEPLALTLCRLFLHRQLCRTGLELSFGNPRRIFWKRLTRGGEERG